MAQPQIVRIPILPLRMVNCHLVIGENGCILVDTGLPGSESKIERVLKQNKLSFRDIKLIIVTHAHMDHAGSAARVRELSGAPIVGHEGDAEYYAQKKPMTFCATGWFGRMFLRTGLNFQPYTPFRPDILLPKDETLNLERFGVSGVARHTPGHTAGSISVQLASGDALVGDLVASGIMLDGIVRTTHAIRPPFEDNPHTVAIELQRLVDSGMQRFYMGHGGPLIADEVHRHAQTLRTLETPNTL
ncbi:MAG: MBL fold metallo-hydrolase [Acidobacteriaceae bacterium]